MKSLILAAASFAATVVSAAPEKTAAVLPPQGTNTQSVADRLRRRTGGLVLDRRVSKGKVVVFDCQRSVASSNVAAYAERLEEDLLLAVKCVRRDSFSMKDVAAAMKTEQANFAVFVTECDCPMTLMTAPEQRFSVVNVKALSADNPDADRLAIRLRKEIARATAFVFGSGYAVMGGGMAMPATSLAELDEVPAGSLSIETSSAVQRLAEERFGFKLYRKTFYVNALREGWAPPPKGTYQKILWEEYHAKPTQPMKIEFDPKSRK